MGSSDRFSVRWGARLLAGPVVRDDGSEAVLKVTLPHREARYEGEGLRTWAGNGAVCIYEEDVATYSLLIERCHPGSDLMSDPAGAEDRLLAASRLLARLW